MRSIIKLIRVKSWLKNVLILLPLLLQPTIWSYYNYLIGIFSFLAFSLTASIVYILNDIVDLESDRQHPEKRLRPLASGSLSVINAVVVLLVLGVLVFLIYLFLYIPIWTLIVYFLANVLYTFKFKLLKFIDVLVLSFFYILRLSYGSEVFDLVLSSWLVMFIIFITMSVSVQKRLLELELYGERNSRRAYVVGDVDLLRSLTVSLFLISVLVFNLYLVFELKVIDYKYFVILNYALLYFCFEFFADRSSDDPVKLLLKHPKLILIGLVLLLLVLFMK